MLRTVLRTTVDRLDKAGYRKRVAAAANVFATALGRLEYYTVDRQGYWVIHEPQATFVSPDLAFRRFEAKERETLDIWCYLYTPRAGDVVLDIGAGIGDEAVVFSKMVGPRGRVFAIEANPRTFDCLIRTVARSGLQNVEPRLCAIADIDGSISISDDVHDHISNSIFLIKAGGVAVPSFRLDSFISAAGLKDVALLKINIEGAELLAIRGLVEHLPKIRNFAISCHDFVADRGGRNELRTRTDVVGWCQQNGLQILQRRDDHRPWVRDYVYAKWPE